MGVQRFSRGGFAIHKLTRGAGGGGFGQSAPSFHGTAHFMQSSLEENASVRFA